MENIKKEHDIITTVFYNGITYLETINKNGENVYFKDNHNNIFREISSEEFTRATLLPTTQRVDSAKSANNALKRLFSRFIIPTLLLSMLASEATISLQDNKNNYNHEVSIEDTKVLKK